MSEPIRDPGMPMLSSDLEDADIQDHIRDFKDAPELCPHFRVLVIGKANAGKTTILRKMCGAAADEKPVVHDKNGVLKEMHGPTQLRGIHDIEDEITFKSNPGFIFHDSCGWEAGSSAALDKAKVFVKDRSERGRLRDQLHAIWYCVPMDGTRPISEAELSFFEIVTGGVPVIAVFTKFDALIDKSHNQLRKEGVGRRGAKERAPGHATELFEKNQLIMINEKHRLKNWVCLSNMHLADTSCGELTTKTAKVLDNDVIIQLFVTFQQNNLGLQIDMAIRKNILREFVNSLQEDYMDNDKSMKVIHKVLQLFPQVYWKDDLLLLNLDYDDDDDYLRRRRDLNLDYLPDDYYDYDRDRDPQRLYQFDDLFAPIITHLIGPPPSALQILRLAINTLIIGEQCFWLSKQSPANGMSIALKAFLESATATSVYDAVATMTLPEKRSGWNAKKHIYEELETMDVAGQIQGIVEANLLWNPHRKV